MPFLFANRSTVDVMKASTEADICALLPKLRRKQLHNTSAFNYVACSKAVMKFDRNNALLFGSLAQEFHTSLLCLNYNRLQDNNKYVNFGYITSYFDNKLIILTFFMVFAINFKKVNLSLK